MQPPTEKPSVLVVGALDTHVANVVQYLVESDETERIRVATYKSLATCCFTPACMEAFERIECMQANLNNAASLETVFARDDGKSWDFIFFFPEQRAGQSDQRNGEDAPINPQVLLHRAMVEMEQEFAKLETVPTIGLRPAILFGSQMYNSAMLPLAIARVYKELDQPAQMPHSSGSPHDFVHIHDVARAFLHVAKWRAKNPVTEKKHIVFNLATPSNTDMGHFASIAEQLFDVKCKFVPGFISKTITTLMSVESLQDDINDVFVTEWTKLLARSNIEHTPISTYIEKEHLINDQFALNGQRITVQTDFQYKYTQITADDAREMLREAQSMRFWPQDDQF
ncbi:hypothetical protein BDF19DRAFT_410946 [Syncephalis fuscata]|nr:hypothetical protein BDF19DRAFT_410946 [Syncephalis fuscata]